MTTVNCPYCGNPINQAAIDIHKKVCSKRPGVPQQPVKTVPIAVTPKPIVVTPPQAIVPQPEVKSNTIADEKQSPAVANAPSVITPAKWH